MLFLIKEGRDCTSKKKKKKATSPIHHVKAGSKKECMGIGPEGTG